MCDAVRSRQEMERGRFDPRDELRRYLESPLVGGIVDVVSHWGVCQLRWLEIKHTDLSQQHQAVEYPTLSRMARDYLTSERAFSGGGITGTPNRNRLSVTSFEVLQLLKSAYRNGHIAAADDAAKHLITFFDSSEADSISDSPSLEV
jgi:hypothetical protein